MDSMSPSSTSIASLPFPPRSGPKAVPNRYVHNVVLGDILFKTWYPSFYPDELVGKDLERLYVCQWCFKYSKELMPFLAHSKLCNLGQKPPPGKLIYQKDPHAIYEVNGEEDQLFTQNLSLFAKLFLDNKSVFYDVSSFNYYLLVYSQPTPSTMSSQVVGFFSKEKLSWDNNNLACILVFPPWQRQGLGKILMSVSYELSKREGRIGGPERPLSELGRKGYIRFWQARVAATIVEMKSKATLSIGEISERCWMLTDDVITALQEMDLFTPLNKQADGESIVVNKAQIRQWINARGIDLTPLIHEGAFLDKWHLKLPQSEEP